MKLEINDNSLEEHYKGSVLLFFIIVLIGFLVYFNSLVELKFILDQINGYSLGTVLLFLVIVVADYFFLYIRFYGKKSLVFFNNDTFNKWSFFLIYHAQNNTT